MGDHSEAIQIDFDPEVVSYSELLEVFLASHNPCRAPFRTQYRSAVFFHDEAQQRAVSQATQSYELAANDEVQTGVEAFTGFTLAEDYHQKYILRSDRVLMAEFEERFPTTAEFLNSPTITRANAFLAGHGSEEVRAADLPRMGLSPEAYERLK